MTTDCSTCRFHSKQPRDKPVAEMTENAMSEVVSGLFHMETADEPILVFVCKAKAGPRAGQEIGIDPVFCTAYETGSTGLPDTLARKTDEALARLRSKG